MKRSNIPSDAQGILFVLSTSHMDYDWLATFEQYYTAGYNGGGSVNTSSVRYILQQALSLVSAKPHTGYQYNLAEIAWLQRYMQDNPATPPTAHMQGRLFFLGGGITSPDSLVCNGEAFIRNYLVGRNYVKSLGLESLLTNVCWIPDDFGHDPQLPVVLTAMGLKGAGFWRVPGNEPTSTGGMYPQNPYVPVNPAIKPLSVQLMDATADGGLGVTFTWEAADNSTILAQNLWNPKGDCGYGIIFSQNTATPEDFNSYVGNTVNQPGNLWLMSCGGDFSLASETLLTAMNGYNEQYYPQTKIYAVMATFEEYLDEMAKYMASAPPNAVQTIKSFDASNFWTGYFSSRVQLKINQQRTVNNLLAAETLSTMLRLYSAYSGPALNGLDSAIDTAWNNIVPSTHHDYVCGTSSDNIYWTEQLPQTELALGQSETAIADAMKMLANAVATQPAAGETAFVVFNPSGFSRTGGICRVGNLVEIPACEIPGGLSYFRFAGSAAASPAQVLQNGNLVFPYTGTAGEDPLTGMGYTTVYLSAGPQPITNERPPENLPEYILKNNVFQVTITRDSGWAISSMQYLDDPTELVDAEKGLCNQLLVYYESGMNGSMNYIGNLYQMGNEFPQSQPSPNDGINVNGFYADTTSTAATSVFVGQDAELLETGEYLCHFKGTVYNAHNDLTMTVEYFLEYNEPLLRMKVTGQAATDANKYKANTVVTNWTINDAAGHAPAGMNYGTGNHWNHHEYVPYWQGPTFRSTHDYLTLVSHAGIEGAPVAAMYHGAMRAWAFAGGKLLGILFRNAPGTMRGANGTDTAKHTQSYAFRLPGVQSAKSCQPLQESIAFQQRLLAAGVDVNKTNPTITSMNVYGTLAEITSPTNAIIRMARTQPGSGGTPVLPSNPGYSAPPVPFSFVLRIYQPTNTVLDTCTINIPLNETGWPAKDGTLPLINIVTALEEEPGSTPAATATYSDGVLTIESVPTITTVQIATLAFTPTVGVQY